ncbi:MAG: phosphate/phosphite/phosphonate ABC transporter substrate-binding protein [Streptococcaceae bacterium]|jgi:phosphonate transport system substrate-binding protein|nr:phosphate/phosphite/phosphonate ABC transporter substrate-binding protein [Streptococcaceae bacterium]MCH4176125.1 phosphate/phosphite/phosphonate ABC transporter substrate-binding protein [Streptococcaceae bacterium]
MYFKSVIKGLVGLLLIGVLAGCSTGNSKSSDSDTQSSENQKLVVQFVPTNNDGSMEAKAKPFAEYLSKKLNREVEVTLATDYSTIVEAMASGQVDIGIMPPAAYIQAKDMDAAEAILTSQIGDYDQTTGLPISDQLTNTFKGEILVKADSDITKLTDLKGKKIATLSPSSASGYIYPVAELKDAGVDPTTESTLTTVNDIPSEITAVLNGQMDAAFVFEGARNVFASSFTNNDLFTDLKVLYLTEGDIPNDAIAVQPKMSDKLKKQIKEVFLNMKNDDEGAEAMSLWNHKGYQEAADSAYDTVREYTEKAAE